MRYTVTHAGTAFFVYDRRADRYIHASSMLHASKRANKANLLASKGRAPGLTGPARLSAWRASRAN